MADDSKIAPSDYEIVVALCVRHENAWQRRAEAAKRKAEAEAALASADSDLNKFRGAIQSLGADVSQQGWYAPIREMVGHQSFDKAMNEAGHTHLWYNREASLPAIAPEAPLSSSPLPSSSSIRELVLEQLQQSGNAGLRAADVRQYIENLRGATLHEKTVGMTLYRLSVDGLARRVGRTWFFVPEAKNPGGETPGLINRDNEKGEEL